MPRVTLAAAIICLALASPGCAADADEVSGPPTVPLSTVPSAVSSTVPSTTSAPPPPPRALGTASLAQVTGDTDTENTDVENTDVGPPRTALADLVPGDCLLLDDLERAADDAGTTAEVAEVEVVDCSLAHDAEIYAVISLDDDPSSSHPGDSHVLAAADRVCLDAFEPYVGAGYVDTRLEIVHLRPTVASWARGDRRVICGVVYTGSAPLVGSVAGAGPGAP